MRVCRRMLASWCARAQRCEPWRLATASGNVCVHVLSSEPEVLTIVGRVGAGWQVRRSRHRFFAVFRAGRAADSRLAGGDFLILVYWTSSWLDFWELPPKTNLVFAS